MTIVDVGEVAAGTPGVGELAGLPSGGGRPMRVDVWRRFRRNKLALLGLAFIVLLLLTAIFAPWIAPFEITERESGAFREGPSADHWFGTDPIGRDVFSRVVYGARVSLRISLSAAVISLVIGVLVGAVAGFVGGLLDTFAMRFVDVFLAIPYIILAVALATIVGRSENSVILILGLTAWLSICRIVRATFLSIKGLEYVEAARALGYSSPRVMLRHALPNALQPIIVYGTISVGSLILSEAALSFLGVGPQEPTPAWGLMVADAKGLMSSAPHLLLFPGFAILFTVLAFVFVGDGLRDALDPKLKQ